MIKETNREKEICQKFVQWLPNVSKAKFYREGQKLHKVYATGIIVWYSNYYANVIPKCFLYDDQFCFSRDPELSKWAINNNFVWFIDVMFIRLLLVFTCEINSIQKN